VSTGDRLNIHKNARLTPHSRAELVRRVLVAGQAPMAVATAMGVTAKTVGKWVARFAAEGPASLVDRSSRPHRLYRPTPKATAERIEALRRQRCTGKQIAQETGVSPATVSRVLQRLGLSRLRDLEPATPIIRYERKTPGEMIHIDIKKLGRFDRVGHRITGDRTGQSNSRGIGWEFVHVAIDDASRIAFSQIMLDQKKESAVAFLKAAFVLSQPWHHRCPRHDRQRIMLPGVRLPGRLPRSRAQTHPHQALHTENQRQGRALHPDSP
jgi:transposase